MKGFDNWLGIEVMLRYCSKVANILASVSKNELFLPLCLWINISELGNLPINPWSIDRWTEMV